MQGRTCTQTYARYRNKNDLFYESWFVTDFLFQFRFSKGINPSICCLFKQKNRQQRTECVFVNVCEWEREIEFLYGNYKKICSGHFYKYQQWLWEETNQRETLGFSSSILLFQSTWALSFVWKGATGRDWDDELASDFLVSTLERITDVVAWITRASAKTFDMLLL